MCSMNNTDHCKQEADGVLCPVEEEQPDTFTESIHCIHPHHFLHIHHDAQMFKQMQSASEYTWCMCVYSLLFTSREARLQHGIYPFLCYISAVSYIMDSVIQMHLRTAVTSIS